MDDLARKRRELIMKGAGLVTVLCAYMTFIILRRARQNTPGKDLSSRSCGKRKRSSFLSEEDALVINNMCDAVRKLASAIKSTVHTEAHPGVCKAVMDLTSFPEDSRFAVLEHLMGKKAMSLAFLQMDEEIHARWVTLFLAKHPAA